MRGTSGMKDEPGRHARAGPHLDAERLSRNLWELTGWKGRPITGRSRQAQRWRACPACRGLWTTAEMGGAVMPGWTLVKWQRAVLAWPAWTTQMPCRAEIGPGWRHGRDGPRVGWRHEHEHARPEECAGREDGAGRADPSPPMPKDRSGEPPQGLGGLDPPRPHLSRPRFARAQPRCRAPSRDSSRSICPVTWSATCGRSTGRS